MEIDTDYAVEMFFPRSAFVQIYFEAVANALDAGADEITIKVQSDGKINPVGHLEVLITDNGLGFTEDHFDRFRRVKKPKDVHHKGLGRLVYLQYFNTVSVSSKFDGKKREFKFTKDFTGNADCTECNEIEVSSTSLQFIGFKGERLKTYDDIKPNKLKEQLVEHFLPLFYDKKKAGQDFRIKIELETDAANDNKDFFPDAQVITPVDIPNFEEKRICIRPRGSFEQLDMQNEYEVVVSYFLRQGMGERHTFVGASIDGRTIPMNSLIPANAIPPNNSAIFLLESELFARRVDTSRQQLVLSDDISVEHLNKVLRSEISAILNDRLPEIVERNTATKKQFEDRYPHLTGYFDENTVGIINRDEAIETAQRHFFREQKQVLESETMDDATFEKSLEVSSRTLTEYILYRDLIIKKLRQISHKDRESVVHNLIVPQRKRFEGDELLNDIYNNNAWLLDDKFMSFRTILSESRMDDVIKVITQSEGDSVIEPGRPDISMVFSADPAQEKMVDAVIVELKRKTDSDKENTYASTQLLQRARNLVDHCPNIQRAWYFAIIEIDDKLDRFLRDDEWTPLYSKGRVYYKERQLQREDGFSVPVPICLLSFDSVIDDAAARNHSFLEILKNDIKKAKQAKQERKTS
mgnify:CR=1 FL=1